jgi:hypothetical protein
MTFGADVVAVLLLILFAVAVWLDVDMLLEKAEKGDKDD